MQPVAEALRLAKTLFPGLKTVGVVWNSAESNSEANTLIARDVCQELGINLLEANVDNSSGVFEAASSLVARGAQALWVGGDVTVIVAIDSVVAAARRGGFRSSRTYRQTPDAEGFSISVRTTMKWEGIRGSSRQRFFEVLIRQQSPSRTLCQRNW
jgi:hypothetical protein